MGGRSPQPGDLDRDVGGLDGCHGQHARLEPQLIDGLTAVKGKSINVRGRLLTVDGVGLKAGVEGFPDVDATVAVTAYLLPADEGLAESGTSIRTMPSCRDVRKISPSRP